MGLKHLLLFAERQTTLRSKNKQAIVGKPSHNRERKVKDSYFARLSNTKESLSHKTTQYTYCIVLMTKTYTQERLGINT